MQSAVYRLAFSHKPPFGARLDHSHRLSRNLDACFLFNEGAGSVASSIGLIPNLYCAFRSGVRWRGEDLDFFGADQLRFGILNKVLSYANKQPLSVVFMAGQHVDSWQNTIIGRDTTSAHIGIHSSVYTVTMGADTRYQATDSDYLQHVHRVLTIDDSKRIRYYRNGVFVELNTITPDNSITFNRIGSANAGSWDQYCLNGLMRFMLIYSRCLSDDEVSEIYRRPYCMVR